MSGLSYNWLQNGQLIEWEKKWGIKATAFLKKQAERTKDWLDK